MWIFLKAYIISNVLDILRFHAVAGWAWSEVGVSKKPMVIMNFSNTFPVKILITDTPTDEVKLERTRVEKTPSISLRNIFLEVSCVGLSFHSDDWALNGHIVFLYKKDEETVLAYDPDNNTFFEGSPEEIEELLKDTYQTRPFASVSSFKKIIAYELSSFFKAQKRVIPSLDGTALAQSSSSSSQPSTVPS